MKCILRTLQYLDDVTQVHAKHIENTIQFNVELLNGIQQSFHDSIFIVCSRC